MPEEIIIQINTDWKLGGTAVSGSAPHSSHCLIPARLKLLNYPLWHKAQVFQGGQDYSHFSRRVFTILKGSCSWGTWGFQELIMDSAFYPEINQLNTAPISHSMSLFNRGLTAHFSLFLISHPNEVAAPSSLTLTLVRAQAQESQTCFLPFLQLENICTPTSCSPGQYNALPTPKVIRITLFSNTSLWWAGEEGSAGE